MGIYVALKPQVHHHMKGSMAYMSVVTNKLAFVVSRGIFWAKSLPPPPNPPKIATLRRVPPKNKLGKKLHGFGLKEKIVTQI